MGLLVAGLFVFTPILLGDIASHPSQRAIDVIALVAYAAMTPFALLAALVIRLVADDTGFVLYDLFNRPKFAVRYEEITVYVRSSNGSGASGLVASGKSRGIAGLESGRVSSLIASKAPHALRYKRWNGCGRVPPSEEFLRLSVFDFPLWAGSILIVTLTVVIGSLCFHRIPWGALVYWTIVWPPLVYDLRDLFASLSITSEGLTEHRPGQSRSIRWEDVTAVFCEKNMRRYSLLVTGPGTEIWIPPHLVTEVGPMRKFFYSLPDGTKMINFDPKFKIGRRRRAKRRSLEESLAGAMGDPTPAF